MQAKVIGKFVRIQCATCDEVFEQDMDKGGRPRAHCYECSPHVQRQPSHGPPRAPSESPLSLRLVKVFGEDAGLLTSPRYRWELWGEADGREPDADPIWSREFDSLAECMVSAKIFRQQVDRADIVHDSGMRGSI